MRRGGLRPLSPLAGGRLPDGPGRRGAPHPGRPPLAAPPPQPGGAGGGRPRHLSGPGLALQVALAVVREDRPALFAGALGPGGGGEAHHGQGDGRHHLRVYEGVDAGHLAGGEGAFQSGADLLRARHQFGVGAEARRRLLVGHQPQFGGDGPPLEHDLLAVAGHAPGLVVEDDADEGQPVADGGVELGEVEAHRAVADNQQHAAVGVGQFAGGGEG